MTRFGVLLLATFFLCACEPTTTRTAGPDSGPGERIYRDGILLSGEPLTALVGGDIPIVGTQFSCESCHGRSGMGAAEGPYVVPPIAGPFLFQALPQPPRPAYDRASLARLLREGITPSGRALLPELMPRYEISDENVDALANYLESLSAGNSPGVDDEVIRFANVVTDGLAPETAAAMQAVLQRFADDINRQTRNESGRWDRLYEADSKLPTVFRNWVFDEWRLSGPRDSWPEQLERYYRAAPVFAVVGGAGTGSWQPVAEFCERNKVACLYPSTNLPFRREGDFYTVYFSAGLLLEAELVAAHIKERRVTSVVQVFCDPQYAAVADALQGALSIVTTHVISFDCARSVPMDHLQSVAGEQSAVVLWLDAEQLRKVQELKVAKALYVSSTLTEAKPPKEVVGEHETFIAHPYRLPGKIDPAMRRFEAWARSRDIDITASRLQAETYFACLVTKDAVKHMRRYFIREYALDMLDHAESLGAYLPGYEQPSFGPGQRFISKGGYILPVVDGELDTQGADWILP
jgi:hypothetical protein